MENIFEKLGRNLNRIWTKKHMSQGDIARALNVDRGYISNIENGKRNPTLATIAKIAKVLKVLVAELLR